MNVLCTFNLRPVFTGYFKFIAPQCSKNVNIPKFKEIDPLEERILHPPLKVIIKRRNLPSIAAI